jgi:hypothetical protein
LRDAARRCFERRVLSFSDCGMQIGCDVIYKGKRYVLRGLEPMSVPDRRAEVEDPESGELLCVPIALLSDPHRKV